jgi:hypothetical protein
VLETPHSLVGGAVGAGVGDPWLAFPAGAGSHVIGDLVPHWNPNFPFTSKKLYAFAITDFVLAEALVVGFYLAFPDRPEIAIGAFAGTVPDIILGFRYVFKIRWLRGYQRIHSILHWEVPLRYGLWPQTALSALAVWYLLAQ